MVGAASLLVLGACSGGSESGAADSEMAVTSAGGGAPVAPQDMPASEAQSFSLAASDSAADGAADADREIITRGSATVVVTDPVDAAARVAALVEQAGGRVEARNEWRGSEGERSTAWLQVRVPADRMTSTIEALSELGTVQSVDVSREDVTATGRDLDARISALEASTERLTGLMSQAGNIEDLLRAERELSSRQAELDSLRSQRTALSDQVAMSTLHVTLQTRVTAGEPPAGFLGGLEAGWNALMTFGRGLLVAVGAALPWLVPAAVIAAVVLAVVRRRRRSADVGGGPGTTPSAAPAVGGSS